MFAFAIAVGIFAYSIFTFGFFGLLYKPLIIIFTLLFWLGFLSILFYKQKLSFYSPRSLRNKLLKQNKLLITCYILLITQVLINLVGTLGPELGFDALWYHLTLPKLYLQTHHIVFYPGGLLYYSSMPKIAEMLYVAGLSFGNEIIPKFIHFGFGILCCFALYKFARIYLNKTYALIIVVIFYSNLVVGWESITAYIDLVRTFFEILALWSFVLFSSTKQNKWFIFFALMLGLAITTKLLSIGSLGIFSLLLILQRRKLKNLFICLLVPLPWFIFSYLNTGNPLYPLFTSLYPVNQSWQLANPVVFISSIWNLFIHSSDPLSPVYLTVFPLLFFVRYTVQIRLILIYSLFALVIWYLTPQTGGGRFILPYLPAFSLIAGYIIQEIRYKKLQTITIAFIIITSVISIGYRGAANVKYIPVLLRTQTKQQFLTTHLNFSYGDFYDTDGYFAKNLRPTDRVLLIGFHNLYYVDFPFIDISWIQAGNTFNYIAVQNTTLPQQFVNWHLIYKNPITHVQLYHKIPFLSYNLVR